MWRLWRSRNDFLFRKINRSPLSEARKGIQEADEWYEATRTSAITPTNNQSSNLPTRRILQQWHAPPEGWLKCNFDSRYIQDREYTSSGWIIRDSNGQVTLSGCAKLQQLHSALQAEALGFLHVLQVTWYRGLHYVWFEGDNLELTNLGKDHHKIGPLLYDIRHWMSKLPHSSLGHVCREENTAADKLSHHASLMNHMYQVFDVIPNWLTNSL
ncbi:PREDICTED: uncharacterized protein LOC104738241 [Camelina sativa]|uniref:Uncharacterized protein LOC104738241 n=1 Tax=Camelina sativa TaxID=90675 RepID=A0ABM0VIK6_CAMSA|nr:PREDICTED: uncharacterized protein LOC104738241 [Camelina sativa]